MSVRAQSAELDEVCGFHSLYLYGSYGLLAVPQHLRPVQSDVRDVWRQSALRLPATSQPTELASAMAGNGCLSTMGGRMRSGGSAEDKNCRKFADLASSNMNGLQRLEGPCSYGAVHERDRSIEGHFRVGCGAKR